MKPSEGALAEYIRVHKSRIIKTPPNITTAEAAGLTLVGLTAYQALIRIADLNEGQSVFINGGSTSVGRIAIQIAKAKGCRVTASCSTSKVEEIRQLGADEVNE